MRERATILAVYDFAREADVHPAVIAGRVRHDQGNYRLLSQLVGSGEVRKQFASLNLFGKRALMQDAGTAASYWPSSTLASAIGHYSEGWYRDG